MTKKNLYILLLSLFIALTIIFFLDYSNTLYFLSRNINYDFWNILINALVIILTFYVTYRDIEKKNQEKENQEKKNKLYVLKALLIETYLSCQSLLDIETIKSVLNGKLTYRDKDQFINKIKKQPFENDDNILELMKDGVCDSTTATRYFYIRKLYSNCIGIIDIGKMINKNNMESALNSIYDELMNLLTEEISRLDGKNVSI